MKKKQTIVVLYSKGRKDLPAVALEEYFALAHRDVDIVTIPDDRYCAGWLGKLRRNAYVWLMRNFSVLYTFYSKIESKLFRVRRETEIKGKRVSSKKGEIADAANGERPLDYARGDKVGERGDKDGERSTNERERSGNERERSGNVGGSSDKNGGNKRGIADIDGKDGIIENDKKYAKGMNFDAADGRVGKAAEKSEKSGVSKDKGSEKGFEKSESEAREKKPSKSGYTKRMRHVLNRFEPDIVVCLTSRSLRLALKARNETGIDCKIYALNADFAYEKVLLISGADAYITLNEAAKAVAAGKGIPDERIRVIGGMPLPRESFRRYDEKEIKEQLGIADEKPVITLVGGRYGRDSIKRQYDVLLDRTDDFNLIAVTGGSRGLDGYFRMAAKAKEKLDSVYILENTDSFSKILSVTDILVTSPTTAVCFEAFFRRIPVVLSKFCGMVEKGNQQYMIAGNLAMDGSEDVVLANAITSLVSNDEVMLAMMAAMEKADSKAVVTLGDMLYNDLYEISNRRAIEE